MASGGFTLLISLAYVYLLRHAAKSMLYMSLMATPFLMIGGGFYLYLLGELRYTEGDSNRYLLRVFAGLLWGFTGVLMVLTLCVWNQMALAAAHTRIASDFLRDKPSVMLGVPLCTFFAFTGFLTYWLVSAVYVFSVGEPMKSEYLPLATIKWNQITRYVWIYHFLGLFWVGAWVMQGAQYVIGQTCVTWYFSIESDEKEGRVSLCQSFGWLLKYHMGSLALGALAITPI